MANIQSLRVFLNQRLTAAAEEIFGAVEKTIAEYQEEVSQSKEENDRLRRLLDIFIKPEIKLFSSDLQSLTVSDETVSRSGVPVRGRRRAESAQIKEEPEEIQTSQKNEDLQVGLYAESIFPPACVSNDYDKDTTQSSHPYQTQSGEDTYREALPSTSSEQIEIEIGLDGEEDYMSKTVESTPFGCKVCGIFCLSKASLINHLQIHTNDKHKRCGVCGKRFPSKQSLIDHLKTHIGGKFCPICGKYFSRNYHLKVHVMVHNGDKPHCCQFCGKGYTQRGSLKAHIRTHTGEKPYNCHVCGKWFGHSSQRRVHMRIHTGERPFRCQFCNKGFTTGGGLQAHMFIHTEEKPHSCHLCGKAFSLKHNLKAHIKCQHKHTYSDTGLTTESVAQ